MHFLLAPSGYVEAESVRAPTRGVRDATASGERLRTTCMGGPGHTENGNPLTPILFPGERMRALGGYDAILWRFHFRNGGIYGLPCSPDSAMGEP
jgi:hypothetical protein